MSKSAQQTIEAAIVKARGVRALATAFDGATIERHSTGWNIVLHGHRYGFRYSGGAVAWINWLIRDGKFHTPTKTQSWARGTSSAPAPTIAEPPADEQDTPTTPLNPPIPAPDPQTDGDFYDCKPTPELIEQYDKLSQAMIDVERVPATASKADYMVVYERLNAARKACIDLETHMFGPLPATWHGGAVADGAL